MATNSGLRKFAERVIHVEHVLNEEGVAGSAGRVVYLLTIADKLLGVPQKEVVAKTALPKDVVSKLVSSLVGARLLTQVSESSSSRTKTLVTTDSGRALLSRIRDRKSVV